MLEDPERSGDWLKDDRQLHLVTCTGAPLT